MSEVKSAVVDLAPTDREFREQVIAGLQRSPRVLPSKFFYDEKGSALFTQICEQPEYYVTRTEMQILKDDGTEMARALGPNIHLIGLGTGAGTKTRILLENLERPVAYLPVDISMEQLAQSTIAFRRKFPELEILPVCADYLEPFDLPVPKHPSDRKVVYFPGSTLGNLEREAACRFLRKIYGMAGKNGGMLIGVDLKKSKATLERAYNDAAGVTAQFNLNLLARANRELGADFALPCWNHFAFYNEDAGRIEMHLVSREAQRVRLGEREFQFAAGEHLITEFSNKYSPDELVALAGEAGLTFEKLWRDPAQLFGVFLFSVKN